MSIQCLSKRWLAFGSDKKGSGWLGEVHGGRRWPLPSVSFPLHGPPEGLVTERKKPPTQLCPFGPLASKEAVTPLQAGGRKMDRPPSGVFLGQQDDLPLSYLNQTLQHHG